MTATPTGAITSLEVSSVIMASDHALFLELQGKP
jgi:hypothetical protein